MYTDVKCAKLSYSNTIERMVPINDIQTNHLFLGTC